MQKFTTTLLPLESIMLLTNALETGGKKKSEVFSLVAKVKGQERKRLEGAGRNVMSIELEEKVLEWIMTEGLNP